MAESVRSFPNENFRAKTQSRKIPSKNKLQSQKTALENPSQKQTSGPRNRPGKSLSKTNFRVKNLPRAVLSFPGSFLAIKKEGPSPSPKSPVPLKAAKIFSFQTHGKKSRTLHFSQKKPRGNWHTAAFSQTKKAPKSWISRSNFWGSLPVLSSGLYLLPAASCAAAAAGAAAAEVSAASAAAEAAAPVIVVVVIITEGEGGEGGPGNQALFLKCQ